MRALVQRVKHAGVTIDGQLYASIDKGLVILLGVKEGDTQGAASFLADKCSALRIFEDPEGKMNLGLREVDGSVLVVSQFTLYGDVHKGNRPSFVEAARPEEAESLYTLFVERMKSNLGASRVKTGVFKAMMDVTIVNEGPVTILIESK
jgi:D-tyrosyl-tRNA(Tyr) deacylase